MLQPATEDDIRSLGQASGELDERFPNMDGMNNAKKSTEVQDFFQKHCTSRTYFFQVKNCNDLDCLNVSQCAVIALSMVFLIQCLLKLTVCCITNQEAIHWKHFCREF